MKNNIITLRQLFKKYEKDNRVIATDNTETKVNFEQYKNHYRSLGYEIRDNRQEISI